MKCLNTLWVSVLCSTALVLAPVALNAASSAEPAEKADVVIDGAKIYTQNKQQPWAQAVAIKDGKLVFVGKSDEAQAYIGKTTQRYSLGGALIIPGLNDAHVHPTVGAVKELYECVFPFSAGPDDIAAAIKRCAAEQTGSEWVRGGQWSSDFFVNHPMESPRKFLDAVSGDKAVVLVDDSYHNAWANTKALALLGVDGSPIDGVEIIMGSDGRPNGLIIEAFGLLTEGLHWREDQYEQAASYVVALANRMGITGIKGTAMTDVEIVGYQKQADNDSLSLHMAVAQMTPYGHREKPLQIDSLLATRDAYKDSVIDANFVKIFMDGVPTAARTAAMLAPYTPAAKGEAAHNGTLHVDPEVLKRDVVALDKAGFTVKIHTAGDRSVRVALDAIEAARVANGRSGLRHELAHAGFIAPQDLSRFASLNAVADLCPYIWSPSPIIDSVISAVGSPEGGHYWPIKDLVDSGAPLLAGSDWPAAVPTINPWPGIEAMVTRKDPGGNFPGKLWAEQAITLEQALKIFTLDGASALKKQSLTGSIEVGKQADFIQLDHDIFISNPDSIGDTTVVRTWFAGRLVHDAATKK